MPTSSISSKGHRRGVSDEELEKLSRVSSTYTSNEVNTGHRDEKSFEDYEQEENVFQEEKEIRPVGKLLELVFNGQKYSRLGIEGPLPHLMDADLPTQGSPAEFYETLQRSSCDEIQKKSYPNVSDKEGEILEPGGVYPKDPLMLGIIYPNIELVPRPPFLLDYYKTWPDEENEAWATSSSRTREEIKGTMSFLHLKKGLSNFNYEVYGFTKLTLSEKSLTDISLFVRLPMTFNALTHVDLSHNKLADISALSGLTTVTHLDVSHNKLKKLLFMYPEWYWNVDEPGKVDIEGNASRSVTQLASSGWALCGNGISQLRWVNYSHNLVRNLEGPKHWAHYPYLSYLDLSHNHISDLRSEERVSTISGGTAANPEGGERCSEDYMSRCGLASLTILHTLNISNNFISRVEGFNGLCVHNLILSDNSISIWEGETGRMYDDERYANIHDPSGTNVRTEELTMGFRDITWDELKLEDFGSLKSTFKSDSVSSQWNEEFPPGKDDLSISPKLLDPLSTAENFPPPTIRVMRKMYVEGNETREDEKGENISKISDSAIEEYPSPKTVEVLFTEIDRKKEKTLTEVLYKGKKSLSDLDHSSRDISIMDASYLENIEGDYMSRRRRLEELYYSQRFECGEDDDGNTSSDSVRNFAPPVGSISCRKYYDSSPRQSSTSCGRGDEVTPDTHSISSMFDYEWEGYESDDPCFAKGRKGKEASERRRNTEKIRWVNPEVEVLHERETTEGERESSEEDGDEELMERLYEEWDDQEPHILYNSALEWVSSARDSSSVEASSGRATTTGEEVRVLFWADGKTRESLPARTESEDPKEDDGVDVLFVRPVEHTDALVTSDVPVCKSVEVLFRCRGDVQESCIEFCPVDDEEDAQEDQESSTIDWVEVSIEVYEPVDPVASDVEEILGEVEALPESTSPVSVVVENEYGDEPGDAQVNLLKRINANRFKKDVGIRSLKWLTELHLERNRLTSLKMFRGTYWLCSLFLQDNLIEDIGEIMYLSELRKLSYLDMSGNPVCEVKDFHQTTFFVVPTLLYLNQMRTSCLEAERSPEIIFHKNPFVRASRIVQDLLSVSELRREHHVPWSCPELDALPYLNSPYPVLLLVGPEGSGNKELCQTLFEKMPGKVYVATLSTTKPSFRFKSYTPTPLLGKKEKLDSREPSEDPTRPRQRYHSVTEEKFLQLLSAGSFASVVEDEGFLFGIEKCEVLRAAHGDRVLVAAVDLTTALVLHLSEFCGKPRLVLVLPESASVHEKNLRRESRNDSYFEVNENHCPPASSEGYSSINKDFASGCGDEDGFTLNGTLLVEHEFVQRNLQARQECLIVHHDNPGVFHCGVFSDDQESALRKVVALLEEMYNERKNRCEKESHKSYWRKGSVSKDLDDKINARLEKELLGCASMWE